MIFSRHRVLILVTCLLREVFCLYLFVLMEFVCGAGACHLALFRSLSMKLGGKDSANYRIGNLSIPLSFEIGCGTSC